MLIVEDKAIERACDALSQILIGAKDSNGLRVMLEQPSRQQMRAIVLGAVVTATGDTVMLDNTHHFTGFR